MSHDEREWPARQFANLRNNLFQRSPESEQKVKAKTATLRLLQELRDTPWFRKGKQGSYSCGSYMQAMAAAADRIERLELLIDEIRGATWVDAPAFYKLDLISAILNRRQIDAAHLSEHDEGAAAHDSDNGP